jgi:hypothetical protein
MNDAQPATDTEHDRVLVQQAVGILKAVELNEPNWTGYHAAVQDIYDWAAAHLPHGD